MSGYHVMHRNHASDLNDQIMERFWNEDNKVAFYSAGKKNAFAKNFSFPSPWENFKDTKTGEDHQFGEKFCFSNSLPGGLHYYTFDGYHKAKQLETVPIPMSIYLDLNYYFNYFCDTSKWVKNPCCPNE